MKMITWTGAYGVLCFRPSELTRCRLGVPVDAFVRSDLSPPPPVQISITLEFNEILQPTKPQLISHTQNYSHVSLQALNACVLPRCVGP